MKSPEGNFRGFFCWNDFMDTFAATLFLITDADPSHAFRMTINVPPHYDDFHATVILNGDKNALWEKQKTGQ